MFGCLGVGGFGGLGVWGLGGFWGFGGLGVWEASARFRAVGRPGASGGPRGVQLEDQSRGDLQGADVGGCARRALGGWLPLFFFGWRVKLKQRFKKSGTLHFSKGSPKLPPKKVPLRKLSNYFGSWVSDSCGRFGGTLRLRIVRGLPGRPG